MKSIGELDSFDKPREKLLQKGVEALKDYELLAVMLGSGIKGKDIIKLSREIAKLLEDDFSNITLDKLASIHGLGVTKASSILSAIELSKRHLIKQNKKIATARDVFDELAEYRTKQQEYFLALYLNGANHLIETRIITIGTINQTLIHPRELFAPAIELRAASVIVAHNHPSGDLTPSVQDINITKRLRQCGELLGIELIDHVVFTKNDFKSIEVD